MSLDIHLTPFLTQQLYKNVLYDLREQQGTNAPTQLGGYQKKILLLVAEKNLPIIADEDLEFLTKILAPCQLGMADVAIVNVLGNNSNPAALLPHYQPAFTLLFGVDQEALQLPLRFPDYQVQPFNNCLYLAAPALHALAKDVEAKKIFWQSLRKLFSLN